eukprot:4781193-Pleurochrysis_carterae.AAC.1
MRRSSAVAHRSGAACTANAVLMACSAVAYHAADSAEPEYISTCSRLTSRDLPTFGASAHFPAQICIATHAWRATSRSTLLPRSWPSTTSILQRTMPASADAAIVSSASAARRSTTSRISARRPSTTSHSSANSAAHLLKRRQLGQVGRPYEREQTARDRRHVPRAAAPAAVSTTVATQPYRLRALERRRAHRWFTRPDKGEEGRRPSVHNRKRVGRHDRAHRLEHVRVGLRAEQRAHDAQTLRQHALQPQRRVHQLQRRLLLRRRPAACRFISRLYRSAPLLAAIIAAAALLRRRRALCWRRASLLWRRRRLRARRRLLDRLHRRGELRPLRVEHLLVKRRAEGVELKRASVELQRAAPHVGIFVVQPAEPLLDRIDKLARRHGARLAQHAQRREHAVAHE